MKPKNKNRQYINTFLNDNELFQLLQRDFKKLIIEKRRNRHLNKVMSGRNGNNNLV